MALSKEKREVFFKKPELLKKDWPKVGQSPIQNKDHRLELQQMETEHGDVVY